MQHTIYKIICIDIYIHIYVCMYNIYMYNKHVYIYILYICNKKTITIYIYVCHHQNTAAKLLQPPIIRVPLGTISSHLIILPALKWC